MSTLTRYDDAKIFAADPLPALAMIAPSGL